MDKEVFERLTKLEVRSEEMYEKVNEMHEVLTKAKGAKWFAFLLLGVYTFIITQLEHVLPFLGFKGN